MPKQEQLSLELMTTTPEEEDMNAKTDTDSPPLKAFPKTQYVRNKNLLRLVSTLNCQLCGFHLSQAAHSNWHGGKGIGIKASDNYIAALCQMCHYRIDQGMLLSKEERRKEWEQAHIKTLHHLCHTDQWPSNVPLTDIYLAFTKGWDSC